MNQSLRHMFRHDARTLIAKTGMKLERLNKTCHFQTPKAHMILQLFGRPRDDTRINVPSADGIDDEQYEQNGFSIQRGMPLPFRMSRHPPRPHERSDGKRLTQHKSCNTLQRVDETRPSPRHPRSPTRIPPPTSARFRLQKLRPAAPHEKTGHPRQSPKSYT